MVTQPTVAVLAIVLRDGKAALVQRKNAPDAGLWGFPGGRLEYGETLGQGACRELAEETGITATPGPLVDVQEVFRPLERAPGQTPDFHFLLMGVLCTYVGGEPVAADDALDAQFVPYDDVFRSRLDLCPDVGDMLRKAIELSDSNI
ncbi:NUDIX hydrolase [Aliiroseovarius sp. 2305UL8-7]|uniref:NUDIX hydrolase n=1 Tax=Aliiroseovarius conchicola TaxID=3121637 RepID=UPI003529B108